MNTARSVILKDVEFLKIFSWQMFESLQTTGFLLLSAFCVVAIVIEILFGFGGEASGRNSQGYVSIFIRVLFISIILLTFEEIIEGAKSFIWALEVHIHKNAPIENILLKLSDLTEEQMSTGFISKVSGGATGLIVQYLGSLGFWLMSLFVNFKLIFFQFVWFFAVIVAPIVLPLGVLNYFENLVSMYVYLIVFLLLIRIPWSILSLCMKNLITVAEHGNVGGFTTGVLFAVCIMMSWGLPTVLGFMFFRSSIAMRGMSMGISTMGMQQSSGFFSSGASQASGLQENQRNGTGSSLLKYGLGAATVGTIASYYSSQQASAASNLPINFSSTVRGGE